MREALLNLRAEGLLDAAAAPRIHGASSDRAATSPTSPMCRRYIGGELAARAAENITDEQLRELESIQDELEGAYERDDLERTVRLNHEFHRAINVAADSPKLTQFMSEITRYAPESVFPTCRRLAEAVDARPPPGGRSAGQARRRAGARRDEPTTSRRARCR